MRLPRLLAGLCAGLCLLVTTAVPARDGPALYALDPVHTRVMFAVDHAGFSKAIGTVSGATGLLRFDPGHWRLSAVEVEVPMARIDLGDEAWNRATLARSLLDAGGHPVARFVSTQVDPVDADRARVHGQLTLRGVTRPVVLDVELNGNRRHPLPPFRRTLGFSATTTLSRRDFGIDAWPSMIGDAVELRLEVEATRTRGRAGAEGPAIDEATIDAPDATHDADREADRESADDAGENHAGPPPGRPVPPTPGVAR